MNLNHIGIFTIDELGRVVIPKMFREKHGWKTGDRVEFSELDNALLIKPHKQEQKCIICRSPELRVLVKNAYICEECQGDGLARKRV